MDDANPKGTIQRCGFWLYREVIRASPTVLYFVITFQVIVITQMLLLSRSNVPFDILITAVVAALVVAKGVVLIDMLPIFRNDAARPIFINILRKAPFYLLAGFGARFLEQMATKFLHPHHEPGLDVVQFPAPGFWAIQIWLAILMLLYLTLREVVLDVGPAEFTVRFFGPRFGNRLVRRFGK